MRSVLQQECLVLYSLPHLAFLAIFCYHKVHWQKTAFCDGRGARDGSLTWPMQFNMTVIILAFTLTLSGVCKVHPAKGELQLNPISENVYHHQRHSIQLSLHSFWLSSYHVHRPYIKPLHGQCIILAELQLINSSLVHFQPSCPTVW